jgi:predicted AlkP superfamily pyrophosphatase or phosphodiesterase
MIHDLRDTTLAGQKHGQFIYPRYAGYNFADISNSIVSLLGADPNRPVLNDEILNPIREQKFKHIILLLIDGLGFQDWIGRAAQFPFFRNVGERGSVTSLTTIFPSTTSSALTAFATGLTPQEHGLPEWYVYMKEIGETIISLPFMRWNGKSRDELLDEGLKAEALFEGRPVFAKLKDHGVPTLWFKNASYANSAYSKTTGVGAESVGYYNGSDLMVHLRKRLEAATTPTFIYAYWDAFDNLEHHYTPLTQETEFELESLSRILLEQFIRRLNPAVAKETLLLITADHGHVEVFPERTIYLSDHPEFMDSLQLNPRGKPIFTTGGMRDTILFVRPEKLDSTKRFLEDLLRGKAEVWLTQEAFDKGLFGIGKPTQRFIDRVGNLLILPYEDQTVWSSYRTDGRRDKDHLRGHHGGLSRTEMFVPFGAVKLDAMQE